MIQNLSTTKLKELSLFLKLIEAASSKKGLGEAIDDLAEKAAEVEAKRLELLEYEKKGTVALAKNEKAIAVLDEKKAEAEKDKVLIGMQQAQLSEKETSVSQKLSELKAEEAVIKKDRKALEADVSKFDQDKALLDEKIAETQALKEKYQGLLNSINQITGNK